MVGEYEDFCITYQLITQAFPACAEEHQWDSKPYWECFVRHFSYTVYHPVGTCAMGSVLDHR